jgi:hypothetical protein
LDGVVSAEVLVTARMERMESIVLVRVLRDDSGGLRQDGRANSCDG